MDDTVGLSGYQNSIELTQFPAPCRSTHQYNTFTCRADIKLLAFNLRPDIGTSPALNYAFFGMACRSRFSEDSGVFPAGFAIRSAFDQELRVAAAAIT
jgi:hypothetical protein